MSKRLLVIVLVALWCNSIVATEANLLEVPTLSIEQVISIAKHHVETEKLDVSNHYLASVKWHPRFGLISCWRLEWRMNKLVKGGQIFVTIDANGNIEHGFGE